MTDIKKIRTAIECCIAPYIDPEPCEKCPYAERGAMSSDCVTNLLLDIKELLSHAINVIRCRECKWYTEHGESAGWCDRSGHDFGTHDDWYCADAERSRR